MKPGEKILSVRRASVAEDVSFSTILQAYMTLEDRGLIEARPQSGFYVRLQPRALPPEPDVSNPPLTATSVNVSATIRRIQAALSDPEIVPLGGAVPSQDLLPVRRLNRALASAARKSQGPQHTYGPIAGHSELRRQIARRAMDSGCNLRGEDILVTFGCMEAIQLSLRAVASPGDVIAVESPTYYAFLQMIEALKMKAVEIPTDPRTGIRIPSLVNAIRKYKIKACLLVTNFNNPLGSSMPPGAKKEIVELLARKEIPLIEDDIYGEIYFGEQRPRVCKSYDKKGLVLLCSSFSKVLSPAYRVGWVAPGRFWPQVEQLKFTGTYTTATPTQMAVAELMSNGGYDHHLRRIRNAYARQVQSMIDAVAKYFPAGTRVTRPQGGFVVWVELPKGIDAMKFHELALREKISTAPGPIFSARGQYGNFIRLNCSHPWSEQIEQAVFVLGRLARRK